MIVERVDDFELLVLTDQTLQLSFVEDVVESLVDDCLLLFVDLLFFLLSLLLLLQILLALVFEVQVPRYKDVLLLKFSLFLLEGPDVDQTTAS